MAIITKGMPPMVHQICNEFGYDPAQLQAVEWEAVMGGVVTRVAFTVAKDGVLTEHIWRRDREPEIRHLGHVEPKQLLG